MHHSIRTALLLAGVFATVSTAAAAQVPVNKRPTLVRSTTVLRPVPVRLNAADQCTLNTMVIRHLRMKAALPKEHQAQLDRLTEVVKKRLWDSLPPDLMASATQSIRTMIPALTSTEATEVAEYVLGEIAMRGAIADSGSEEETQMGFDMAYLTLQMQMDRQSQAYSVLSNVMKKYSDTMSSIIGNIK